MPRSTRQKFILRVERTLNHLTKAEVFLNDIFAYIRRSKWKKEVKSIIKSNKASIKQLKKVYNEWS